MLRRAGAGAARALRWAPSAPGRAISSAAVVRKPAPSHTGSASELRGLNSSDMFAPDASLTQLRAGLLAALHPPSSSTQPPKPNPDDLLRAASAYIAQSQTLPEQHLGEISARLSAHYIATPVSDSDVVALADVLAACCLDSRTAYAVSKRSLASPRQIAKRYGDWLVAEAQRASDSRAEAILSALERQLRALAEQDSRGVKLSLPFVVPWTMLRARLGRPGASGIDLVLPNWSTVQGEAVKLGIEVNEALLSTIKAMCTSTLKSELPDSVRGLGSRLMSARSTGDVAAMTGLWDAFSALDQSSPLAASSDEVLALFVRATRPRRGDTASERDALLLLSEAVSKRIPKPTPLPILHELLAAPSQEESPAAAEESEKQRHSAAAAAKATWDAAKADGVVMDVKAYEIYLSLLGRYHDWATMFDTWDEMVKDMACKGLHDKQMVVGQSSQGKPTEGWPPTIIMNQVLSHSFLIGGRAAQLGSELYSAAIDPSSPLVPDIATINTVLRFAAHLANIPTMNEVIATARTLGLKPDIITYTTLVQGLLRAERPDMARATLDAMRKRGIEPNERMASMLVADLAAGGKADSLRRAEDVIRDMRARGIKTTVPMWTALIGGYFQGGWDLDGWNAFERARKHGCKLNAVGYNILLERTGQADAASGRKRGQGREQTSTTLQLFREMVGDGVVPTWETYSVVLRGLLNARRYHELVEVIGDVDRRRFKTTKGHLTRLLQTARTEAAKPR